MKKLITLLALLCSVAANAQHADLYLTGGSYTDQPTRGSYNGTSSGHGLRVYPYRSFGYYLGAGGGWLFKGGKFTPGLQLEANYIAYRLTGYNYTTYSGGTFGGIKWYSHMRYLRIAPSFTLSRSFDCFTTTLSIGPDYNHSLNRPGKYIGLHTGLRLAYRGVGLNIGYAMGIGDVTTGNVVVDDYVSARSRAFNAGISLHPVAMFGGKKKKEQAIEVQ